MTKACAIVLAGLLLGACYSASATDTEESTKDQCRALLGVDSYDWAEIVRACEKWEESGLAKGRPNYYYGRTLFDKGYLDEAIEQFRAGAQQGDRFSTIALHFAQEGATGGGNRGFSERALDQFQRMAENGDPIAKVLLGHHLAFKQTGNPSPEELQEMLNLFEAASDAGEPVGVYLLGSYLVSDKNPDNDGAGIRLLYTAAEDGVGAAYEDLQRTGEIDEVPVDIDRTRYRWGTPMDLVMRQP